MHALHISDAYCWQRWWVWELTLCTSANAASLVVVVMMVFVVLVFLVLVVAITSGGSGSGSDHHVLSKSSVAWCAVGVDMLWLMWRGVHDDVLIAWVASMVACCLIWLLDVFNVDVVDDDVVDDVGDDGIGWLVWMMDQKSKQQHLNH
jgi:hypothetical protein